MSFIKLLAPLLLTALVLFAVPGHACQTSCHSTGAVALPAELAISLPFEEGATVQLLSAYGPTAGSSLHCRAQDPSCANDYYALDFVLPNKPNYGKGEPVLAIAAGTVLDAGWGSEGWAAYGRRVYLRHQVGGHTYVSMYAHLDSIAVSTGQSIGKGELLGTLGGSCNGANSCSNFSTPHVHFSIHRDSSFGGSGSGGSYGGRAVIPEPLDGYSGLQQGQQLTSANGGQSPPPPVVCDQVVTGETVLQEDGACVVLTGGALGEADGDGGHAYHTRQDNPSPDYAEGAVWQLTFEAGGDYELWAYVPSTIADLTSAAVYKVAFDGSSQLVSIDQDASAGSWAYLGTFAFAAGEGQWVRLGDNYDDVATNGKRIAIDALRALPSTGCDCGVTGDSESRACDGGTQTRSCDGCYWSPWSACSGSSDGGGEQGDDPTEAGQPGGPGASSLAASAGGLQGVVCSLHRGKGRPGIGAWLLLAALCALAGRKCRR